MLVKRFCFVSSNIESKIEICCRKRTNLQSLSFTRWNQPQKIKKASLCFAAFIFALGEFHLVLGYHHLHYGNLLYGKDICIELVSLLSSFCMSKGAMLDAIVLAG